MKTKRIREKCKNCGEPRLATLYADNENGTIWLLSCDNKNCSWASESK